MDAVLIVGSEKTVVSLGKLMVPRYYGRFVHAASASAARQIVSKQVWGLVVVSAPLPDGEACACAVDLAAICGASVLLLDEDPAECAGAESVIALGRPVNRGIFENTLYVLAAARAREARLLEENRKLAGRVEEARLVGQAKCALVAYRRMTEGEAHRYINQQAMDGRLPKREVAKDILQMFEGTAR